MFRCVQDFSCVYSKAQKEKGQSSLSFSTAAVCAIDSSSPCLLTRLSGPRGSWWRNDSWMGPLPSGFGCKLAIKWGAAARGDVGEERMWVHEEWHTRHGSVLCSVQLVCPLKSLKNSLLRISLLSGQLCILIGKLLKKIFFSVVFFPYNSRWFINMRHINASY